jgi:hypothetical protein
MTTTHDRTRLAELEAEVAELRRALGALAAAPAPDAPSPGAPAADEHALTRRGLLRTAGVAAAAGITGAALIAKPAGAADGGALIIGTNNAGSTGTALKSGPAGPAFLVDNSSTGIAISGFGEFGGAGVRGTGSPGLEGAGVDDNHAPLHLVPSGMVGPPFGPHVLGELVVDSQGVLFQCIAPGTPGIWGNVLLGGINNPTIANQTAWKANGSATGLVVDNNGTGNGIQGSSAVAIGVKGFGVPGLVGAGVDDSAASLRLVPRTNSGPPSGGAYTLGEFAVDSLGALFQCVAAGSPGTWIKVVPLVMLSVPVRVYDSRPGTSPAIGPKTALFSGQDRTLDATVNGSGVPASASAILVNLTVVNTTASGFLAVFKGGIGWPGTSSINWFGDAQILANGVTTAVANLGMFAVHCGGVNNGTDFLVDVVGYYP